MRRHLVAVVITACLLAWAAYSFWIGGFAYVLVHGTPDQGSWVIRVREVVAGWGRFAPIVYVMAVVVEVIVAPIPGTLLYAPAGAIFGGLLGGTLSLVGNVIGAAISCALGSIIGDRIASRTSDASRLMRYRDVLRDRGLWVVLLLRLNPLTSSDLVSYAAGIAGVPAWKVAAGTLVGMAPLCYVQAYFAQRLFEVIPGPLLLVTVAALGIVLVLVLCLGSDPSRRSRIRDHG